MEITFNDLFFIERKNGTVQAVLSFGNGYVLSVIYGDYTYSSYRITNEEFNIHNKYNYTYEVAIINLNDEGKLMPLDFLGLNYDDTVIGYQSPEDINKMIKTIIEFLNKKFIKNV